MIFNACLEVVGIAAVAPLIAVITNPESIDTLPFLNDLYTAMAFDSSREFSIFLGAAALAIILVSNASILLTNYFSIRYANNREFSIGARLLGAYLNQPYVFIYLLIKAPLYSLGKQNVTLTGDKLRIINDSLRIVRDLKMLGIEKLFMGRFDRAARDYSRVKTLSEIAALAPRYVIEVFALSALITAMLYLLMKEPDATSILPLLGIYAFASYRLMPALQMIFNALSKIQFSAHSLDLIANELQSLEKPEKRIKEQEGPALTFEKEFGLRDIHFSYNCEESVLKGIDLSISKGHKVGLIGGSGAGKSTLVDVLAGLSLPNSGELYLDGTALHPEMLARWRKCISYVSQNVYLLDDTVDMNIALTGDETEIDKERAGLARRLALVDEFLSVMNETPELVVGENGARISGGQRQRIGIARALYQNRPILILDEATSALDQETEKRLLKNIESLGKTMLIITHRVETLSFCEEIYVLLNGKVVDKGPYTELERRSEAFIRLLNETGRAT